MRGRAITKYEREAEFVLENLEYRPASFTTIPDHHYVATDVSNCVCFSAALLFYRMATILLI